MRAAVIVLVCAVAIVSTEDPLTGLHLSSADSKIIFGSNSECTIELKHDGGSTFLQSSCPISTPEASDADSAAPADDPLTCDQVALTGIPVHAKLSECGKYSCGGVNADGCAPCESVQPTSCDYGDCDYTDCVVSMHCTFNNPNDPYSSTGCASCTSIQSPSVIGCQNLGCGWDGTSTTCSPCSAFQAADQAACEAVGCTKSTTNDSPAGEIITTAADGYCISTQFGVPPMSR